MSVAVAVAAVAAVAVTAARSDNPDILAVQAPERREMSGLWTSSAGPAGKRSERCSCQAVGLALRPQRRGRARVVLRRDFCPRCRRAGR